MFSRKISVQWQIRPRINFSLTLRYIKFHYHCEKLVGSPLCNSGYRKCASKHILVTDIHSSCKSYLPSHPQLDLEKFANDKLSNFSETQEDEVLNDAVTPPEELEDELEVENEIIDDFNDLISEDPAYGKSMIKLVGHDYAVLESFINFMSKKLPKEIPDIIISEVFPMPTKTTRMHSFLPNKATVSFTVDLKVHERIMVLPAVPIMSATALLEYLQCNLPEGVTMTMHEFDEEYYRTRFKTETEILDELSNQLDTDKFLGKK